MNNPPLSALILGDTGPDEFRPAIDLVHRHVAAGFLRQAADLATFRQMTGSGWFSDLLIALQAWPDQFSVHEVEELISLCPLARILCCFGPWCDSDGRTRSIWPLGVRVPAAAFASRFEHEVALLANSRDVGSQLKNGDWLRPAGRNSEQSACGEAPVPLFQKAAGQPLPLTASRTEIFEFDFARSAARHPSGHEVSVISPDRRFRDMLASSFKASGFVVCESVSIAQPSAIIFDADPWDGERARSLAAIRTAHPRSQLIACVGFPRPHVDAELRLTGADGVWFKLAPLADSCLHLPWASS